MRKFETLNDLANYVPNCLICNKPMVFNLNGILSPVLPNKPRWGHGSETIRLKLEIKGTQLRTTFHEKAKKTYSIVIDLATNGIIDGQDVINRLVPGNAHVSKFCPTCHLKIHTGWDNGSSKKKDCFPVLTLQSEELHYTLKGGKDVEINKYYRNNDPESSKTATIRVSRKYLPPIPFDFNKFSDLEQLNKRLNTIILFH